MLQNIIDKIRDQSISLENVRDRSYSELMELSPCASQVDTLPNRLGFTATGDALIHVQVDGKPCLLSAGGGWESADSWSVSHSVAEVSGLHVGSPSGTPHRALIIGSFSS
jgi:hypothetical protein